MTATVLYPRAALELHARVAGQDVVTFAVPSALTISRRDHGQAGECEATISVSALPFDPTTIEDLWIGAFFGDVGSMDGDVRQERFLQFMGYADEIEPDRDADKAPVVKVKARDFSAVLRHHKPLSPAAVPRFGDTLPQAIDRILGDLPDATRGVLRVVIEDTTPDEDAGGVAAGALLDIALGAAGDLLANATHGRPRHGRIPAQPTDSAWDVLERVCLLAARRPAVVLDALVIRAHTPPSAEPEATFAFGDASGNLIGAKGGKKFQRNRRPIRLISWNPVTHTRTVADWPPSGSSLLPPRHRAQGRGGHARAGRRGGRARAGGGGPQPPSDRDVIAVSDGTMTHAALLRRAQTIWTERSRQEYALKVVTPFLGPAILGLRGASRVAIFVTPALEAEIRRSNSIQAAATLLRLRLGCDYEAAEILARVGMARLFGAVPHSDLFYARTVTLEWSAAGKSTVTVEAVNLIVEAQGRAT